MYCYHVWETYHPCFTNGKPLYLIDIYSTTPIRNKSQIMECIKEQSVWYEIINERVKNENLEVIPMSNITFLFNLVSDIIHEKISDLMLDRQLKR